MSFSILFSEDTDMSILKRAAASVQARFIQPWQQKHFENTKHGGILANCKNKYVGQRCFFIGNGPSLRADDLTVLYERHEITFAFNRIYNIFSETPWRPDFYISQDEKMLSGCLDIVKTLDLPVKFIPIQLKWYYGIDIPDTQYFNIADQQTDDPYVFHFSNDIEHEIFNSSTVMYTAAQIAAYMGFKEIYLIGVDHHFQISQNNKGEIIVDNSAKDYFSDKYNEDKANLYIPNTEKSTLTYIAMKQQCSQRGISVFNATRGGKLEVFPRVDFDSLFV